MIWRADGRMAKRKQQKNLHQARPDCGCEASHPAGHPHRPADARFPILLGYGAQGEAAAIWALRVIERPEEFDAAWPHLEHRAIQILMSYESDRAETYRSAFTVFDGPGAAAWAKHHLGPAGEQFNIVPMANAPEPTAAIPVRLVHPRVFDQTLWHEHENDTSLIGLAKDIAAGFISRQWAPRSPTAASGTREMTSPPATTGS